MSVSGSGGRNPYGDYFGGGYKPFDCGNPNGNSDRTPDIQPKDENSNGGSNAADNGEDNKGGCIICGNNGGDSCSRNLPGGNGSGGSSSSSEGAEGKEGGNKEIPGVTYNENGEPQWVSFFNIKA